ncbi:MAG: putative butyrate kinase [Candidatus Methanohalarchaeum thermophilum]|uniref:Butyrate kinase n=1 Tax=Methanohalarchaeum thermophilum TaxID=1903181 RepID=A0A1Q6DU91_METT1|nr:MAG: putative butyrate kinase [Candidatus Methanohalarchaeum thermophilum]
MRAVGIDPGTKSMDICGIENDRVYFERSIETEEVLNNPKIMVDELKDAKPFDTLAAPSGYGVEPTNLSEVNEKNLEDWYYQYILLTEKKYVERAIEEELTGALLYKAMAESIKEIKREDWNTWFIPGVINLPTVPKYRKVNKIDMGTADKLAVTALSLYKESREKKFDECSYVLLEMGFGYNSVLAIDEGRLIDGVGGTTISGPGFLTISSIDAEFVQLVGQWDKGDVFKGGAATISRTDSPDQLLDCIEEKKECKIAYEAMIEGVIKAVNSLKSEISEDKVYVSGRLSEKSRIIEDLKEKLDDIRKLDSIKGAEKTKKTAQGYGIVAGGLTGGHFSDLIEHMKIPEASGTSLDYLYHPKAQKIEDKLVSFK